MNADDLDRFLGKLPFAQTCTQIRNRYDQHVLELYCIVL